jgi:23S rRNA pseudouridine2604 synthase
MNPAPARPQPPDGEGERLAKRLARDLGCSRAQAERYVEAGLVTVDGAVVDTPPARVRAAQRVELARGASPAALEPVTLLLHKPAGLDTGDGASPAAALLVARNRAADDRSGVRILSAHLRRPPCLTPLEATASGLVVFSQDPRIARRLVEDAALLEHESMVDVVGRVEPDVLAQLARGEPVDGRPVPDARVSVGSGSGDATRLRFAIKGHQPGRIERACARAGLGVTAIRRTRIGRVPLAGLPPAQWRCLGAGERF